MTGAGPVPLDWAYATCLDLARAHYENFPVASRLLPPALRPHVAAIYAFARTADDFADEPGRAPDERLRLLDDWRERLRRPARGDDTDADRIFASVHDTIAQFNLPIDLFEDLLSAFEQDVTTTRYETWTDVLDYCRRSANPVGRLVLRLMRQATPERDRASDAICTALQLTNFWQDFAVDWRRGRLYLPAEEWQPRGAATEVLDIGRPDAAWRASLAAASARTRRLFERGRPLCDEVSGRLRYELRATWLGGMAILDALVRIDYDVFTRRPTLGLGDRIAIGARTLAWQARDPAAVGTGE